MRIGFNDANDSSLQVANVIDNAADEMLITLKGKTRISDSLSVNLYGWFAQGKEPEAGDEHSYLADHKLFPFYRDDYFQIELALYF